jgi:predicted short-subunit dehydrogenase-like oxidoreductase (DUF2520 family)
VETGAGTLAAPPLSVAGAGAVGTALARALAGKGWPLGEIACRTAERARDRCRVIGGGQPVSLAELADAARAPAAAPALLLVAVPDRALAEVAAALARRRWPAGSVALHVSGAADVDVRLPLARAGLQTGALHPLKSFVSPERDADTLAGTVVSLQGAPAALALGERIAALLGLSAFPLAPGQRPAWHAAATHACNHLVALLDQALDLMQAAGLPRDAARAALLPLMRGTLDNLAAHPPGGALTGPVVRGDVAVVERHLQALGPLPPDVGAAYRALASRALRLASEERGLDPALARALAAALATGPATQPTTQRATHRATPPAGPA